MTDIVERLREIGWSLVMGKIHAERSEAADEIERLREAIDLFLAVDPEKTHNWLHDREKAAALVKEYLSIGKDFLQVTKALGEKE